MYHDILLDFAAKMFNYLHNVELNTNLSNGSRFVFRKLGMGGWSLSDTQE